MWQQLVAVLLPYTGPQPDEDVLLIAWPPVARDFDMTVAMLAYVHRVWPPTFTGLTVVLRVVLAPFLPLG
jgi:hypothetical protein